ncbi:MAG: hypothetical protein FWH14_00775 [Oscillospiraceae bacterium]|nr:hypothetical protein [Oscillospiraceae bacterium]
METANYNLAIDPVIKTSRRHKFPFDVRVPNSKLIQAMQETEQILEEYANGTRISQPYTNIHDILQEILNEENDDDV